MITTFKDFVQYQQKLLESPKLIPTYQRNPFESWYENPNIGENILKNKETIIEPDFKFNNNQK